MINLTRYTIFKSIAVFLSCTLLYQNIAWALDMSSIRETQRDNLLALELLAEGRRQSNPYTPDVYSASNEEIAQNAVSHQNDLQDLNQDLNFTLTTENNDILEYVNGTLSKVTTGSGTILNDISLNTDGTIGDARINYLDNSFQQLMNGSISVYERPDGTKAIFDTEKGRVTQIMRSGQPEEELASYEYIEEGGEVTETIVTTNKDEVTGEGDEYRYDNDNQLISIIKQDGSSIKFREGRIWEVEAADGSKTIYEEETLGDGGTRVYIDSQDDPIDDPVDDPTDPSELPFMEENGSVAIEAESVYAVHDTEGRSWQLLDGSGDYSGSKYLKATGSPIWNSDAASIQAYSAQADFKVHIQNPGTYYLWFRCWAPDWNSDSVHCGLDGQLEPTGYKMAKFDRGQHQWSTGNYEGAEKTVFNITDAGEHTINFWIREPNFTLDKFILTQDPDFIPQDMGPAESQRKGASGGSSTNTSTANVPDGLPREIIYNDQNVIQSAVVNDEEKLVFENGVLLGVVDNEGEAIISFSADDDNVLENITTSWMHQTDISAAYDDEGNLKQVEHDDIKIYYKEGESAIDCIILKDGTEIYDPVIIEVEEPAGSGTMVSKVKDGEIYDPEGNRSLYENGKLTQYTSVDDIEYDFLGDLLDKFTIKNPEEELSYKLDFTPAEITTAKLTLTDVSGLSGDTISLYQYDKEQNLKKIQRINGEIIDFIDDANIDYSKTVTQGNAVTYYDEHNNPIRSLMSPQSPGDKELEVLYEYGKIRTILKDQKVIFNYTYSFDENNNEITTVHELDDDSEKITEKIYRDEKLQTSLDLKTSVMSVFSHYESGHAHEGEIKEVKTTRIDRELHTYNYAYAESFEYKEGDSIECEDPEKSLTMVTDEENTLRVYNDKKKLAYLEKDQKGFLYQYFKDEATEEDLTKEILIKQGLSAGSIAYYQQDGALDYIMTQNNEKIEDISHSHTDGFGEARLTDADGNTYVFDKNGIKEEIIPDPNDDTKKTRFIYEDKQLQSVVLHNGEILEYADTREGDLEKEEGSQDIKDTSSNNHSVHVFGDTRYTQTDYRFGGTSLYFDGDEDYLRVNDSAEWDMERAYTIQMWINPDEMPYGKSGLISHSDGSQGGDADWALYLNQEGELEFWYTSTGVWDDHKIIKTTSAGINANEWSHIALSFDAYEETLYIFKDGKAVYQNAAFTDYINTTSSDSLTIGAFMDDERFFDGYKGYIDEIKVTAQESLFNEEFDVQPYQGTEEESTSLILAGMGSSPDDYMDINVQNQTFRYDQAGNIVYFVGTDRKVIINPSEIPSGDNLTVNQAIIQTAISSLEAQKTGLENQRSVYLQDKEDLEESRARKFALASGSTGHQYTLPYEFPSDYVTKYAGLATDTSGWQFHNDGWHINGVTEKHQVPFYRENGNLDSIVYLSLNQIVGYEEIPYAKLYIPHRIDIHYYGNQNYPFATSNNQWHEINGAINFRTDNMSQGYDNLPEGENCHGDSDLNRYIYYYLSSIETGSYHPNGSANSKRYDYRLAEALGQANKQYYAGKDLEYVGVDQKKAFYFGYAYEDDRLPLVAQQISVMDASIADVDAQIQELTAFTSQINPDSVWAEVSLKEAPHKEKAFSASYDISMRGQWIKEVEDLVLDGNDIVAQEYTDDGELRKQVKADKTISIYENDKPIRVESEDGDVMVEYSYYKEGEALPEHVEAGDIKKINLVGARSALPDQIQSAKEEIERTRDEQVEKLNEAWRYSEDKVINKINALRAQYRARIESIDRTIASLEGMRAKGKAAKQNRDDAVGNLRVQQESIRSALNGLDSNQADAVDDVNSQFEEMIDKIDEDYDSSLEELVAQEAAIENSILQQEASPIIHHYYRKVLGRDPSKAEYDQWVQDFNYDEDTPATQQSTTIKKTENLGVQTLHAKNISELIQIAGEESLGIKTDDKSFKYDITLDKDGDVTLNLDCMNFDSDALPTGYTEYQLEILVDGVSKKTISVPANLTEWQNAEVVLEDMTVGGYEIEIKWLNDVSPQGGVVEDHPWFKQIGEGSVLSGTVMVEVDVSAFPLGVDKAFFYIGNGEDCTLINKAYDGPFRLGGVSGFDTTNLPDGNYSLGVMIDDYVRDNGVNVNFTVANNNPPQAGGPDSNLKITQVAFTLEYEETITDPNPPANDLAYQITSVLSASDEFEDRTQYVEAVRTQVNQAIEGYLSGDQTARDTLLNKLGLSSDEVVSFYDSDQGEDSQGREDIRAILDQLEANSLHFGQSATLSIESLLFQAKGIRLAREDLSDPDSAKIFNEDGSIRETREALAATAILIDILAGIITPEDTGDLVLSIYSLKKVSQLHDVPLEALHLYWQDLQDAITADAATEIVAHVRGNHFIIITDMTDDTITYTDPGVGPDNDNEEVTISKKEFLKIWQGNAFVQESVAQEVINNANQQTERVEDLPRVLTDNETKRIRGAFLGLLFVAIAAVIQAVAVAFVTIAIAIGNLIVAVGTLVGNILAGIGNIIGGILNGLGGLAQAIFEGINLAASSLFGANGLFATAAGQGVATGAAQASFGSMIFQNVVNMGVSYVVNAGLEALGVDPMISRYVSAFATGGIANGFDLGFTMGSFMSGALQGAITIGAQDLAMNAGLDPTLSGIIGMSLGALVGQIPMPGDPGAASLLSAFNNIKPQLLSSLASWGMTELGDAIGLEPEWSNAAGMVAGGVVGGWANNGQDKGYSFIDTINQGLIRGATSLGVKYAIDRTGMDPLVGSLTSRAVMGAISGMLQTPQPDPYDPTKTVTSTSVFDGIYNAFTSSALNIARMGKGTDPWTQSQYIQTVTKFSDVVKDRGIAQAIEDYATQILHSDTVESILMNYSTISEYVQKAINENRLKKVNIEGEDLEIMALDPEAIFDEPSLANYHALLKRDPVTGLIEDIKGIYDKKGTLRGSSAVDAHDNWGLVEGWNSSIVDEFNSYEQFQRIKDGQQTYAEITDRDGRVLMIAQPDEYGQYLVYDSHGDMLYGDIKVEGAVDYDYMIQEGRLIQEKIEDALIQYDYDNNEYHVTSLGDADVIRLFMNYRRDLPDGAEEFEEILFDDQEVFAVPDDSPKLHTADSLEEKLREVYGRIADDIQIRAITAAKKLSDTLKKNVTFVMSTSASTKDIILMDQLPASITVEAGAMFSSSNEQEDSRTSLLLSGASGTVKIDKSLTSQSAELSASASGVLGIKFDQFGVKAGLIGYGSVNAEDPTAISRLKTAANPLKQSLSVGASGGIGVFASKTYTDVELGLKISAHIQSDGARAWRIEVEGVKAGNAYVNATVDIPIAVAAGGKRSSNDRNIKDAFDQDSNLIKAAMTEAVKEVTANIAIDSDASIMINDAWNGVNKVVQYLSYTPMGKL